MEILIGGNRPESLMSPLPGKIQTVYSDRAVLILNFRAWQGQVDGAWCYENIPPYIICNLILNTLNSTICV